ncbi:MAG: hypothetical protein LQ350_008659 [Teloschistes chrysophthalmus]|nr:MAG: hypothetical protein LQ350_008659 [Niorma chrysophthalma]
MANPLADCVSSLRSSNHLLSNSISILDSGVNDFPRLAKVLQTTKHFELLPSSALSAAQTRLLSSLTPEFNNLLARVETHLDRLERREQNLIARCELLEGRLSMSEEDAEAFGKRAGGRKRIAAEGDGSREALRLKQLRAKKERLGYAVERLGLQAQQKERQLRLSVAAQ